MKGIEAGQKHQRRACRCCKQQTVNSVQHATMPGNQTTRVLGTKLPLHPRLEEVTTMAEECKKNTEDRSFHDGTAQQTHIERFCNTRRQSASQKSRPGFVGRKHRHELRSTDQ